MLASYSQTIATMFKNPDPQSALLKIHTRARWSCSTPSFSSYRKQKGIRLCWGATQDTTDTNSLQWPTAVAGGSSNASQLLAARRAQLFTARINGALHSSHANSPAMFPGTSPVLASLNSSQEQHPGKIAGSYRQFLMIQQFCAQFTTSGAHQTNQTVALSDSWRWKYIKQPAVLELGFPQQIFKQNKIADQDAIKQLRNCLRDRQWDVLSPNHLQQLFPLVRNSWAAGTATSYSNSAIDLVCSVLQDLLQTAETCPSLELLFELEMLCSYATLLEEMQPLACGIFGGSWLDIGTMSLSQLHGTERCQIRRLLDELHNLSQGRTAPVIINENFCVADGNHRVAAVWLWNMLHICKSTNWSLEDDSFQHAISNYIAEHLTPTTLVSLHEALHYLGIILSDPGSEKLLTKHLRPRICNLYFDALPVVPLLEYCSLAVIAREYEAGRYSRLDPAVYELLTRTPGATLPARACYHFADRVPLPWFSQQPASCGYHHTCQEREPVLEWNF